MSQPTNELAIVTKSELSKVDDNRLNMAQLAHILKATPAQYVKERPAKGGGKWRYVTGGYVKKSLNLMFGWDWDFKVTDSQVLHGEVIVLGELRCRVGGHEIIKMQYGNKEIAYKTETRKDEKGNVIMNDYGKPKKFKTDQPLSIGNDMKAATTDALKKCAAEIGIAADIYNAEDFNPIKVIEDPTIEEIEMLFDAHKETLPANQVLNIQRVIDEKETSSYNKAYKYLNSIK